MRRLQFDLRRVVVAALLAMPAIVTGEERPVYLDSSQSIDKRIEDLLARMTPEEKVSLCHANSIFATAGVARLGIPELVMDDGPMGVREDVGPNFRVLNRSDDYATAMPAPIALAATFDVDLARACGQVIGQEARYRGKHIMLNPAINIQRTPLCGRNFEYFGEDPFLAGRMAVNFIQGEQAEGVAACVKHFAANNQENQRGSINVEMDERTLREIYLPAFEASVKEAGVLSIMGAYNKFRGQSCCENDYLLNKVLKDEWGFKGVVVSDWGAVHSTDGAALGGLDIEMGTRQPYETNFLATPFLEGLNSGKYSMSVLDDKVRRHLYAMFKLKMLDGSPTTQPAGSINTAEHWRVARSIAEQSIALLKNDRDFLPLDLSQIKSIAVIGANAVAKFTHTGFGATVKAMHEVTPLEGIVNRVGNRANVIYSAGYNAPSGARGARGRGATGSTTNPNPQLLDRAIAAAKSADVVIYVGGLNHTPGHDDENTDRGDLKLTPGQDELIQQIVAANPRTIVVLYGGAAVEMDAWLNQVPSVLQAWYGGMEAGDALARVLFGDVNPSGRLPCTFPKRLADSPAHAMGNYPGTDGIVRYEEGLLVGYRWFDTKKIDPLFPFGHGLSYTKFEYSNLKLVSENEPSSATLRVEFDVTNTGGSDGAEVAQVYVEDVESALPRPIKELKGVKKMMFKRGEKQTVSVPLDQRAFAYYDPQRSAWIAEAGAFVIQVGSSSRDIRLKGEFRLPQTLLGK